MKRPRMRILGAGALIAMALSTSSVPADQGGEDYRLRAGDRVEVRVHGHEDLSGEFEISGFGTVPFPLVGRVMLEALTVREAERAIVEALKPDYLKAPSVGVEVLRYRAISVVGEVEEPGRYDFERGLTVMEAVAMAGGFTTRARRGRLSILPADEPGAGPRDADDTTRLHPGDTVVVPRRFF